ncbi:MAG TPA: TIGR03618 family F420-dependent PPOX class oxidoreductase [Candidatus Limnocylindrales bacterium]|nr:TIGR03618 family F420-dependent PPOX class oxidoreductase [Candidatus Limnocylindrales bacterium]
MTSSREDVTGITIDPALHDLLERPLLARLATVDDDGYPAVVPVWFEWADGAFWIVARARAAYLANLSHRPLVGLSIVDDRDPDRRLHVRGRATLATPGAPLAGGVLDLARRLAERYEGAGGLEYVERSRAWPRVLVRIDPDRIVGWASPDWHPRYRDEPYEEDG